MLLALETATDVCSAALFRGGAPCGVYEVLRPRAHSEELAEMVRELLHREGAGPTDLRAVAVSAGPGSYTGLRIGVSLAKGLCAGAGADLVGVPSLRGLARQAEDLLDASDILLAAFRSRRGEVYAAAFRRDVAGLTEVRPASSVTLPEIDEWIPPCEGTLWLCGEAASLVDDASEHRAFCLDPELYRPRAESIGRLGHELWKGGHREDLAAFEPHYLKPFEVRQARPIFDRLNR